MRWKREIGTPERRIERLARSHRAINEQVAFERELPGDSGEIDLAAFIGALQSVGYDGPLTCEPMNTALNDLDNEEAAARTFAAMHKVVKTG